MRKRKMAVEAMESMPHVDVVKPVAKKKVVKKAKATAPKKKGGKRSNPKRAY